MTLEDIFPQFFHGPKKLRRFKLWAVLIVFVLAVIGVVLHIISISVKSETFWEGFAKFFDDIGINLLIGLVVYQTFEYLFGNIDKKYGLLRKFSYAELVDDVTKIQRGSEVKIFSIFLRVFTSPVRESDEPDESDDSQLHEFKELKKNFRDAFIHACKNNNKSDKKVKVSILILDPLSFSAIQRTKEMEDAGLNINIIEEIIETLKELTSIYNAVISSNLNKSARMFEVRIYNRTPPFSLFQIDDHYSFSFYPRKQTIQDANHFSFYEDTPFQKFVSSTFDEVWKEETTFDLHKYLYVRLHYHTNSNAIKDIFYIDVFMDEAFPDKRYVVLIPTNEQAKKLSETINASNEITLSYRDSIKIKGRLCAIKEELACLNCREVPHALELFYKLAFKKYPYDMIFGDKTSLDNIKLVHIEVDDL